ncbi:WD repeat domain-containing protein [Sarocladium implicatum]|nr:WD repeat domain-containing protein [Sarocladium implicatum]
MDDRTIQHNHSGNLVLYSTATGSLEPSVVASSTDSDRSLVFTAAFDKTVKVWKTGGESATSMDAVGTWPHEGNVNFVATAANGSGLVATAADVSSEAVRVYKVDAERPSTSPNISLSCPCGDAHGSDEWAYWPSTLQWGTAEVTQYLLAVGYSPRSRDGDENKIPKDKFRTGAILLWDSRTGREIPVHAPTVANVFEVIWHPTLSQLIVATSRTELHVEEGVRTQIHIWKQDPVRRETDQGWDDFKNLDCTAEDINELTIMPNSSHHAYITASCTSGEIFFLRHRARI